MRESRYTLIYVGLLITLIIWGISLSNVVFGPLNWAAYDLFTQMSGSKQPYQSNCLLIEGDYQDLDAGDSVWLEALNRLDAMGARQIIFVFMPSGVTSEFYEKAQRNKNVYFGRQRIQRESIDEKMAFEIEPSQARGKSLKTGLADIPPGQFGIHRLIQTYWQFSGNRYYHVIVLAARDLQGSQEIEDQFALVNFIGGEAGIPTVDLKSVLSGNLIKEMVKDKSAIVGFRLPPYFPDLKTPLTSGSSGISPIKFYAYAFDTLVEKKIIRCFGETGRLFLIFLTVFVTLLVYQLFSPLKSLAFAAVMVILSVLFSWIFLKNFLVWIPLSELMTAGVISLIFAMVIHARYDRMEEMQILLERSGRSQAGRIPESFFRSKEHWMQVANMVNQTLNTRRSIFFEKIEGESRLKEIVSLNMSLQDVRERRRDFLRNPYARAINQNGPVRVVEFLSSIPEDEEEFLVPLSFLGNILGFWSFTIQKSDQTDDTAMLQAAEKFAVQIGEILYRRKAWLEQESERLHPVRRFLGFAARQRQTEQIGAFIDMLSANLSLLESAFDTLRSPAMLTDIFGRVLLINAPMSDLGNMVGIDPYKMTALDVVARLSERDPGEIRKALTNVILHEDAIEFPATISVNTLGRSYILSVKAVRGLDRAVGIEANAPFSLYGLLVQLRDVSDPMDLINIRENFIEHSVSHIRKRLDSLLAICLKICDPSQKEAIKHSIFDELTKKKVAVEASMDELQMFMGFQESGRDIKYLPTDVRKLFDDAKSSIIDQAEAKQLTFLIESPDTSPIALAPPRELGEIFSIILSILIKDALQNTALSIRIREDDESVSYSLGSSGFGMRNEDLKAYMDPSFQDTPNEFHNLGILKTVLDDCYGSLTYQAVIGQGMTFMIKLTKSLSC